MKNNAKKYFRFLAGILISFGLWGIVLNMGLISNVPFFREFQNPVVLSISFLFLFMGYFIYFEAK